MRSQYSYPARLDRDEEGRYQVRFADLPDALTDGADPAEALTEAADCLSAAIASRIIDGEAADTKCSRGARGAAAKADRRNWGDEEGSGTSKDIAAR
jgi:predicted RNase H-like HicB family nuclease